MTTTAPAIPVAVTVPRVAGAIILVRPTYIPKLDIVYNLRATQDVSPTMREILASMAERERRRYHVVRLDTMTTLPGLVLSANVETGSCSMLDEEDKTAKQYDLGPGGIRIV